MYPGTWDWVPGYMGLGTRVPWTRCHLVLDSVSPRPRLGVTSSRLSYTESGQLHTSYLGLVNGETRSGETRSGETRSGETRSGETRSDRVDPDRVDPDRVDPDRVMPGLSEPGEDCPSQARSVLVLAWSARTRTDVDRGMIDTSRLGLDSSIIIDSIGKTRGLPLVDYLTC